MGRHVGIHECNVDIDTEGVTAMRQLIVAGCVFFGIFAPRYSSAQLILIPVAPPQVVVSPPVFYQAPVQWAPVQTSTSGANQSEQRYQSPTERESAASNSNMPQAQAFTPAPMYYLIPGVPVLAPVAPAPESPTPRVERYYFDPATSQTSRASWRDQGSPEAAVPGQIIIREFYYVSPSKPVAEEAAPSENEESNPANDVKPETPGRLNMPPYHETLRFKEAPRPAGELTTKAKSNADTEKKSIDPSKPAPAPSKAADDRSLAPPRAPRPSQQD
jgi:hypothetical protein